MKNLNLNRRNFLWKSIACSVCFTSSTFITDVLASGKNKTREEILNELDQKVEELMPLYRNCAQTSFGVLNDQFKLKAKKMIRGLKPFPGMALRGETCGAVTGSVLAIGLFFEPPKQTDLAQQTDTMNHAYTFCTAFEKEFGSTMCKGVQKHQYGKSYDLRIEEEWAEFVKAAASGGCMDVVKKSVRFAGEIIIDNS